VSAVPDALNYYDLPELEALLSPIPLTIINPVFSDGKSLNKDNIDKLFAKVKDAYSKEAQGKFNVSLIDEKIVPGELARLFQ